jgi:hypothetical protein
MGGRIGEGKERFYAKQENAGMEVSCRGKTWVMKEPTGSLLLHKKANLTTDEHGYHGFTNSNGPIELFLIRVNQCYSVLSVVRFGFLQIRSLF